MSSQLGSRRRSSVSSHRPGSITLEPPITLLHPVTSSHDDPKRERSRRELGRVTSRQRSRDVGRVEEGDGEREGTVTPTGRSSDGLKPSGSGYRDGNGKKQNWFVRWVKVWGRGMWHDVRNRAPYYASDWTDAWNYRVVPATLVCPRLPYYYSAKRVPPTIQPQNREPEFGVLASVLPSRQFASTRTSLVPTLVWS